MTTNQYVQQTVAWQVTFDPSTLAAWQAYGGFRVYPYAVYRSKEPQDFVYQQTFTKVRADGLVIPDTLDTSTISSPINTDGSFGTKTRSATWAVGPSHLDPFPGPPIPVEPQNSVLIGFGYIFKPDAQLNGPDWQKLPQDDPVHHLGQIGLTDPSACMWYWGEQVADTGDGRDVPMGQIGPQVPEAQTWGCPCGWFHGSDVDDSAVDPVHTVDSSQFEQADDAAVPGPGVDFDFVRSYNGADTTDGPLGPGWTDQYNASLSPDTASPDYQPGDLTFRDPTGGQGVFHADGDGGYVGAPGVLGTLTSVSGGGWTLVNPVRRETLWFDADGHEIKDVNGAGQGQTITWSGSGASAHVASVTDAANRTVSFSYGTSGAEAGKLTQLQTADGRTVKYGYTAIDGASRLTQVTAPDNQVTTLSYDDATGKLDKVSAPDAGHDSVQDTFDTDTGRVNTQTDAEGNVTHFDWAPNTDTPPGSGTETITDANGHVSTDDYYGNLLIQHTDGEGDATTYSYDANADLTSVTDPNGHTTTMTYDANGRMLTRTNPLGETESWVYDTDGNLLSHTSYGNTANPGKTTSHTYTGDDLLESTTDPRGHTTTYTYWPNGLVKTKTVPRDANTDETTQYAYDNNGNLTSVTSPTVGVTSYTYFASGLVSSMTDPDGNVSGATGAQTEAHTTHYTYYDNGLVHTVTDPNDNLTTDTYDGEQNLTEEKGTDATGTVASDTVNTYDNNNRLITTTVNGVLTRTNNYDGVGNLDWTKDGDDDKTTFGYDHADRRTTKVVPNGNVAGANPAQWTWTYGYDKKGNRTSVQAPGAARATVTAYDALNRVHTVTTPGVNTPGDSVTTTDYYPDGLVKQVTDPNNKTTSYVYDDDGNLTGTTSPRNKTATDTYTFDNLPLTHTAYNGTSTTTRTYDADGNLKSVTDPDGNTTSYDRFPDGRVQTVHRPDTTTLGYTYDGNGNTLTYQNGANKVTHYGYNGLDQQTSVTDPAQRQTTYAYDPAGTTTQVTHPDNTTITYTVDPAEQTTNVDYSDPATHDVTYGYDADGNRKSMVDGTGTTTYFYDHQDRLYETDAPAGSTKYGYDGDSDVTTITYPNNKQVTRHYDPAHQLTSVTDWLNNTTTFGHNDDGTLTSEAYPNQVTATYAVDDNDAVTSITDTTGTAPNQTTLASFGYGRDANGQVTSEHDTGTGSGSNFATLPDQTYTYTKLNQLNSISNTINNTTDTTTLTYNGADDPTTLADGSTQSYDDADQATNHTPANPPGSPTASYRFDSNGNRLDGTTPTGTGVRYRYDGANRLTSSTTPSGETGSGYHPVDITRLVNTQNGTGSCTPSACATLPAGGTLTVQVAGNAGIPATGVKAVTLNVTALNSSGNGSVVAYPAGATRPGGRSLSTMSGSASSSAVISALSADGKLTIYSSVASDLLVEVTGWYANPGPGDTGADFEPINGTRILDTRNGTGSCSPSPCARLAASATTTIQVTGQGGIPTTGVSAVAFTLTTFTPSATGYAVAWNADLAQPNLRDLSYPASTTASDLVVAKPSAAGKIKLYSTQAADYTIDLAGYYTTSPDGTGSIFVPYDPTAGISQRILDTRSGSRTGTCDPSPCATLDPATPVTVTIAGHGAVPGDATAAVLSATAWNPTGAGGLVAWPADQPKPGSRNLSYPSGVTTTGAAQVALSPQGKIGLNTLGNATDLTLDVEGWYEPAYDTTTYTYNGDNLRATTTATTSAGGADPTTTHTYTYDTNPTTGGAGGEAAGLLTETSTTDGVAGDTTSYLYGPDGVPFEQVTTTPGTGGTGGTDTPTYLHTDQYGSVRATTDAAGTITGTTTYNPTGTTTNHTGTTTNLGWAGQYHDPTTGLYYLRARYYDPTTNQFTTRDPSEAQTQIPYSYAFDNPLNFIDTTGKNGEPMGGNANEGQATTAGPSSGVVAGAAAAQARNVAAYQAELAEAEAAESCTISAESPGLSRPSANDGRDIPIGPAEEGAWKVLNRIDENGSPLPGYKGGKVYGNTDDQLPRGVDYREWDLDPKVKGVDRNDRRLVTGSDGSAYYTTDHYVSFIQIR